MNCPYCGAEAHLETSVRVYRKYYGWLWICSNYPECDSYVGCHKGTTKALGSLANKSLRLARIRAHAAFDKLWRNRRSRSALYKKLAKHLNVDEVHIGQSDFVTCEKIIHFAKYFNN